MSETLADFNAEPRDQAERELMTGCASRHWARDVARGRPYPDLDALLDAAEAAWWNLGPADWLEAFSAHPRIGEQGGHQPSSSNREQKGVMAAEPETREAIAEANRTYEARFGHVFLISAAGRSAADVLAALRERMDNDPKMELRVAAGEQARITRLRLERMLGG